MNTPTWTYRNDGSLQECTGCYRFGFQGQETDPEYLSGAVSFKYRVHDARLGRFLSVDSLVRDYPMWSPFVFGGNLVIWASELEGLEPDPKDPGIKAFVEQFTGASFGNESPTSAAFDVNNLPESSNSVEVYEPQEAPTLENNPLKIEINYVNFYEPGEPDWSGASMGLGLSIAEYATYNKHSWFSFKQMKFYPSTTLGNQHTGGKIKHGKMISGKIGFAGKAFGVKGLLETGYAYGAGQLTLGQAMFKGGIEATGTFGGLPGASFYFGVQAGRDWGPLKWYGDDDLKYFE